MNVLKMYVEKRPEFADEAASVASDLRLGLQIDKIDKIRIINRYLAQGISCEDFNEAKKTVFSEAPVDIVYDELPSFENAYVLAVEYLPGQFDQRADSCAQCIAIATGKERPDIHCAKIYLIYGDLNDDDFLKIKSWLINPVENREISLEIPQTLVQNYNEASDIEIIGNFIFLSDEELDQLRITMGLAMDLSDIKFCQEYFKNEKRSPSVTEIRVLDTYWSDHCRHTTFLTELDNIQIDDEHILESYKNYLLLRETTGRKEAPVTLMDMATIGAKHLKQKGLLNELDESYEINACSVKIKVDVNGKNKNWLLMFKNETHNHPTEIEPFGGAATCLGGAIRDPLSGRAFVYQAMRVTGAGNPLQSSSDTLQGKLPQRKICRTAAEGYSSYGNQIGLATGHVIEIYHPGYTAKRMETGAVIAAAPSKNVIRKKPGKNDVVILLGGRTGRDGIGGATGSSKSHTQVSLETCAADVQKGNAPDERKLQRFFRDSRVTRLIKRCNDFGAGGVSVSVGELADGLLINLDKVPIKYEGLDGTEIAISESQERMSLVVAKRNAKKFIALAAKENLEATVIAKVTKEPFLVMNWRGKTIVNLSRKFISSNGAQKRADVHINNLNVQELIKQDEHFHDKNALFNFAGNLNICSQKGLVDSFDSCIGAATVISPFGGKYQLTPAQAMAAKIPLLKGDTNTCSIMSLGFDPYISSVSPYHGAVFAVVHSVAKIIAAGGSRKKSWLSFQEYFEKLRSDPARWGKPVSALLGALDAQLGLEIAAIGGKDSMAGSYAVNDNEEINVPPALLSFAISVTHTDKIVTPEFKKAGSAVFLLKTPFSVFEKCDFSALRDYFDTVEDILSKENTLSAWAAGSGGIAEAIIKMCMGNKLGFCAKKDLSSGLGFSGFIIEVDNEYLAFAGTNRNNFKAELLGRTKTEYTLKTPSLEIPFEELQREWEKTLEPVYPGSIKQEYNTEVSDSNPLQINEGHGLLPRRKKTFISKLIRRAKPQFILPVFPGTNSEYDIARAIEKAGGKAQMFVIRNLTSACTAQSIAGFKKAVVKAQAIVIPGGFSGADEPDNSGKYITAFMKNPFICDAVMELLNKRYGLICGIGTGFHALLKLGLLPYGEIREQTENSPTLSFNATGRHQCALVNTKLVSNKSPWLSHLELEGQYMVPLSRGEGRFIAKEEIVSDLADRGQIATIYVDFDGNINRNQSNSSSVIEGITSFDGRIFGRIAHNERLDDGLYKNIPGIRKMDIFKGAVKYFD